MAQDALRARDMFNIIDTHTGYKADFYIEATAYSASALAGGWPVIRWHSGYCYLDGRSI